MAKVRGTSNVPMILGIIGGVIGLPGAVCSGACAACIGALGDTDNAEEKGSFYMAMGLLGALAGLFGGIFAKRKPIPSGIVMLAATFMSGFTSIAGNLLAIIVAILFLIGGIFCFVQRKEEIDQEM